MYFKNLITLCIVLFMTLTRIQAVPVSPQYEDLIQQALNSNTTTEFQPLLQEILQQSPINTPSEVAKCIAICTAKNSSTCLSALGVPFVGPKLYATCMGIIIAQCSIDCA